MYFDSLFLYEDFIKVTGGSFLLILDD